MDTSDIANFIIEWIKEYDAQQGTALAENIDSPEGMIVIMEALAELMKQGKIAIIGPHDQVW